MKKVNKFTLLLLALLSLSGVAFGSGCYTESEAAEIKKKNPHTWCGRSGRACGPTEHPGKPYYCTA